jgi:hypothetical protein
MKFASVLVPLAVVLPALGFAQSSDSYVCTMDTSQRRVEILRETGVQVPCEVHYYKDTEAPGEQQVLWRAQTQVGYCEEKAGEFVTKLQEWGWNCSAGQAPDPEPVEEMPQDDTEMLSPATEDQQNQQS